MKTLPILFVALALLLSACEKESEIVNKNEIYNLNGYPERIVSDFADQDKPASLDGCIKLTATHWLTGSGKYEAIKQRDFEAEGTGYPSSRFVIEASGDAASEILARGFTTLSLIYDGRERRVTGNLTTQFYFGEVLELEVDGAASLRFEGNDVILSAQIKSASLLTDKGRFELEKGDILFILPSIQDGSFTVDIDTEMVMCLNNGFFKRN